MRRLGRLALASTFWIVPPLGAWAWHPAWDFIERVSRWAAARIFDL